MYRICFLHPDLGIGGAERAIVDAAVALKLKQINVSIFTNYHDRNHCFEETKNGELKVKVVGNFIPRSVLGRFCALFAYIRMVFAALYIILFHFNDFDLIYVDQISAPLPLLKLFGYKVLFYAHFPDMLLSKPGGLLKSFYRVPIDFLEKVSLSFADMILYNSKFTSGVYQKHFNFLKKTDPIILYPVPNVNNLTITDESMEIPVNINSGSIIFLSINRYENKKNIDLAVKAFALLRNKLITEGDQTKNLIFIHMGGYDEIVPENQEVFEYLDSLIDDLKIRDCSFLLKSCSNNVKVGLLKSATALIYTPANEHFGIVPLEAMYLHCPVVAVNSGGPLETVLDGVTGYLCPPEPTLFADAMKRLLSDSNLRTKMGDAARDRVCREFSFARFQDRLEEIVEATICR